MNEENYAFPYQYKSSPTELTVCLGMTLRDYFAAKAINECLKSCVGFKSAAEEAYLMADAMLEARK
jgi:hypothetical protein